jgi:Mn2+/Fe2+ NRAMP family transporter
MPAQHEKPPAVTQARLPEQQNSMVAPLSKRPSKLPLWKMLLVVAGPGLVVMLADTDAGSVITAAQSGAQFGYSLVLLQLILVPILYIVQELTVRLGLVTQKGHGELISASFGKAWAWLSVSTLMVSCIGALLTEFAGIEGVGRLFGISPWISIGMTIVFLVVVVGTGSYRQVEVIALFIGLFELAFIGVALACHPSPAAMLAAVRSQEIHNPAYLFLIAGNVGAVIMPWMVFYQQSAVIDKGLNITHLKPARLDTAIGAVVTQVIMAAVLIFTAASIGRNHSRVSLDNVQQIATALTPVLGHSWGRVVFALGMLGAAMVATIVVSLTAAWGLGEVAGYKRSLAHHPFEAPWFYGVYLTCLLIGAGIVLSGVNLVRLTVGVEVMNALLLPIVLGLLFLLARKALPDPWRLKGPYAWVVGFVVLLTSLVGVYAGIAGVWG